jgi:HEAT repeat protein
MAYFMRPFVAVLLTALICGCMGAPPATEESERESPAKRNDSATSEVRAVPQVSDDADADLRLLKDAKIGMDRDRLIAYLKTHSASDDNLLGLDRLVEQLGNPDFETREEAMRTLIGLGPIALEPLRKARALQDKEAARCAANCALRIEGDPQEHLLAAAVRSLARTDTSTAIAALLEFLPCAVDDALQEEIYFGLDAFVRKHGTPSSVFIPALHDPLPARRAAASLIVGRAGSDEEKAAVGPLLHDHDPMVRLRAAQGLLAGRKKEAVPTLIDLLEEPTLPVAWQAEELLHYAAGFSAPAASIGSGQAREVRKCRKAWDDWWQTKESSLSLDSLGSTTPVPRLILTCDEDIVPSGGISLYGSTGGVRWRADHLPRIADVRILTTGSLLMLESDEGRLREQTVQGKTLWQESGFNLPVDSYRDTNGYTTVVTKLLDVHEIGPNGVSTKARSLTRMHKLVDVHILEAQEPTASSVFAMARLSFTSPLTLIEFDIRTAHKKAVLALDDDEVQGNYFTLFPIAHENRFLLLVCNKGNDRLLLIDGTGHVISRRHVDKALHAIRLRNGNTLLACRDKETGKLVEIAPDGKMLYERQCDLCPTRVRVIFPLLQIGFTGFPVDKY